MLPNQVQPEVYRVTSLVSFHERIIDGHYGFAVKEDSDCRYFSVERRDCNTLIAIPERECACDSVIHISFFSA